MLWYSDASRQILLPIETAIEEGDIVGGDEVAQIVSKIRAYKSENNYSLKEELSEVTIVGYSNFVKEVESDLKGVGGILNIKYEEGEKEIKIVK